MSARRIDAKTAVELFNNGLYELLGEVRRKEKDFVVNRREEIDAVVYTYLVKRDNRWDAVQTRFKRRRGWWEAQIHARDAEIFKKNQDKLGLKNKIYKRKDGRHYMELYVKAMI